MKTKRVLIPFLLVILMAAVWFLFCPGSGKPRSPADAEPTAAGPSPAVKAEWAKLRGTWEFVAMEVEGVSKPDEDFKKYTLVVEDDQWTIFEYGKPLFRTYFMLDPT